MIGLLEWEKYMLGVWINLIVGCVAALLGDEVTLTDMPDRLRLLRKNVECNLSEADLQGSATFMELVWWDHPQPHLTQPSLPHYGTTFTIFVFLNCYPIWYASYPDDTHITPNDMYFTPIPV